MRYLKYMALFGLLVVLTGAMAGNAKAATVSVGIGVGVGPAPVCAYGYYPSYPYGCAPAGYYGPEWFANGVFIGAGPWFHPYPGFRAHGFVGRDFGRAVVRRGPARVFRGGEGFRGGRR